MDNEKKNQKKTYRGIGHDPSPAYDGSCKKQGQVGKVTAVSGKENDIISVQFPDGKSGNYMSDGLLTLLPKAKIIKNIGANPDLTNGEKWALLKIVRDITWGEKAKALEKTLANTKVLYLSTTDFSRQIQGRKKQEKGKRLK